MAFNPQGSCNSHLGITPTFLRLLACSPSTSGVNPDDDAALSSAYSSQPVRPPPRNDVLGLCKYCSNRQSNNVFIWPTAVTVNAHTSGLTQFLCSRSSLGTKLLRCWSDVVQRLSRRSIRVAGTVFADARLSRTVAQARSTAYSSSRTRLILDLQHFWRFHCCTLQYQSRATRVVSACLDE